MVGTIEPIENNAYRIKHLKVDVEVGDRNVPGFKPELKLKRWDGECSLTIGFQECDEEELELETDDQGNITKIKWKVKSDDFELELEYEALDPREETLVVNSTEHKFLQCDEGGLELRIILSNKPLVNVLEFTFQTEGLVLHYQPSLHPDHPTWNDKSVRPENVVGSYAVYHATRTNMHSSPEDAEKYKACKAFQIYFPYLIDAEGWKERAEDFVIENGLMRITLPQAFLDSAVYPVVVDPDWGNTGTGDTAAMGPLPGNMLHGTAFTSPAVAGMTGVSMSLFCYSGTGSDNLKMGIWVNADGGALIANGLTGVVAVPEDIYRWASANFVAAPNITQSTIYLLSFINQTGNVLWKYDTGAGVSHTDWANSYAAPENFDWSDSETELICIYVTYTTNGPNGPNGPPAEGMEQVIIGGTYFSLHTLTTEYNSLFGGADWHSAESTNYKPISTDGLIKNLRVVLTVAPGGTDKYTFTLMLNGNPTALTFDIVGAATTGSDMVNEIDVAPGDYVSLRCIPTDIPASSKAIWTSVFKGDTANESLIAGGTGGNLINPGVTDYAPIMGAEKPNITENDNRQVCPTAGIIKNLYIRLATDPGTAPDAYTFTVRLNGATVAQSLIVTIVANDTTGSDLVHELVVAAGDVLTMMIDPTGTPDWIDAHWGMTFVADINGESIILGGSGDSLSSSSTEYNRLINSGSIWLGIENQRYQLGQVCTLKKLYILLSASPGGTDKYDFTLRVAIGDGNVTVEIAGAATTGNSGVLEDAIILDNYLDLKVIPTDTPAARDAFWGLVGYIEPPAPPEGVGMGAKSPILEILLAIG